MRPGYGDCAQDGFEYFRVAGAAAEISGESDSNIGFSGMRIPFEQIHRRENHSGSADPALRAAVRDEGLLYGVELLSARDAFNGADRGAFSLQDGHEATVEQLTVHLDAACAAFTFAAAFLDSSEIQLFAESIEKARHRKIEEGCVAAVHAATDADLFRHGPFRARHPALPEESRT